jgi:hypothetical protein
MPRAVKRLGREAALAELRDVLAAPDEHTGHAYFARVAVKLIEGRSQTAAAFGERDAPAPFLERAVGVEPGDA